MTGHLRLLAWLRWKYLWRTGGRGRRIGAVIAVAASLGLGLFLFIFSSTGLGRAFERQEASTAWELVHLAFTVLYLFWLYSGTLNDLYDPARFAPYPIAPRSIFVGSTLASFIGLSSIFGASLLAGFAFGIPGTPVQVVARALLFVFLLVHLQLVSRLIRLTFLAVLTSRRWRDAAVLISTLLGGGLYLSSQMLRHESSKEVARSIGDFAAAGGPSFWLAWCPAVWFSWASELDGFRSAAAFGAFALLTGLVARAGGWAELRLAYSEPIFHYRPKAAAASGRRRFLQGISRLVLGVAGPTAAAVARKETAVFFRDPAIRHRVLTSFIYVLIPIGMMFLTPTSLKAAYSIEIAGYFLVFIEMFFLTNIFGVDGIAVRSLLTLPASRRRILLGKNLAYLGLFLPFNLVVLGALAAATGAGARLPLVVAAHVATLLVVVALGNVNSVYFPVLFLAPGQRMARRDENGCLVFLARSGLYLLTVVLLSPVLAAMFFLEGSSWALPAAVAGVAYAAGLYVVGLRIAEAALLSREEALGDYFRAA